MSFREGKSIGVRVDARKCFFFWKLKDFLEKEKKEVWKSNKRKEESELQKKNFQA